MFFPPCSPGVHSSCPLLPLRTGGPGRRWEGRDGELQAVSYMDKATLARKTMGNSVCSERAGMAGGGPQS